MSTRKLLLIVLPLLFVFNNTISYIIFYSSNAISESYHRVLDRVMLYQEIEQDIRNQVSYSYQYIIDPSHDNLPALKQGTKHLSVMANQLKQLSSVEQADLVLWRFKNLITAFLLSDEKLYIAVQAKEASHYTQLYTQLSQLASFISEDSYQLIGLELSTYQKWYSKILLEIDKIELTGVTLLAINTLLSLLLSYWISIGITKPIRKLVTVAENIADGELRAVIPSFPQHSEFRLLAESFEQMQTKVQLLFEKEKETMEKDRQLTQLELEVLQNQINPHFLFNSLNILSKLALIEGAEKTSDLTVALSNLFRYNLKQLDRPVPLKEEVDHAKDYFYIQQARFRDRVTFQLDIDEDQLATLVPVLTLQPILENIFVHGIEGLERAAKITLKIYKQKRYTVVEISDNGVGMDEETRLALLNYSEPLKRQEEIKQQPRKSTGIGTRNVFRRIELLYQENNLVDLISVKDKGTTVFIRIPQHE